MARNRINHLLVIRLSAMGDVAMTVPVIIALTQKYPELRITYLTKAFFVPILSSIPNVTVVTAEVKGKHKGFYGLWRLFKELKSYRIDAVADLHNVLRSNILKILFRIYGIPFKQLDKGRKEKKILTYGKREIEPLRKMHERYMEVFTSFGFDFSLRRDHVLPKQALPTQFKGNFEKEATKNIGIAPFAAYPGKVYPLSYMESVIEKLGSLRKVKIFLFGGGPKEEKILKRWQKTYPNCFSVAGSITFLEELNLISNLDVMISMDSGNGHLAAMYGVPVITLWGVTHPYAGFTPFGQNEINQILSDRNQFPLIPTSIYGNKFPSGYEKVMETISPQQVYDKIVEIL